MKTLMVLRHAKSPHIDGVDDHERPIYAEAGRQVAELARHFAAKGLVPDMVLSSDAARAVATARAYGAAVGAPPPVLLAELYEPGEPADLLAAVRQRGGDAGVVLMVGHNPGLAEFCNLLTPTPQVEGLGTGTVAVFEAEVPDWRQVRFGRARLLEARASHG